MNNAMLAEALVAGVLAGLSGLAVGMLYFRALQRSVGLLVDGRRSGAVAALTLARIAGAVGMFVVAASFGAIPLLSAAAGFLVARQIAVRLAGGVP